MLNEISEKSRGMWRIFRRLMGNCGMENASRQSKTAVSFSVFHRFLHVFHGFLHGFSPFSAPTDCSRPPVVTWLGSEPVWRSLTNDTARCSPKWNSGDMRRERPWPNTQGGAWVPVPFSTPSKWMVLVRFKVKEAHIFMSFASSFVICTLILFHTRTED